MAWRTSGLTGSVRVATTSTGTSAQVWCSAAMARSAPMPPSTTSTPYWGSFGSEAGRSRSRFRRMQGAWWLLMTTAAIPCSRGWPGAAAARGGRGSPGSLAGFGQAAPRSGGCLGRGATGCLSADLELPADPAWRRLDALGEPVLSGLIRRNLAEVRTRPGQPSACSPACNSCTATGTTGTSCTRADCQRGSRLRLCPPRPAPRRCCDRGPDSGVEDSAQIAVGYFGARSPAEHELDLIATAQRARGLGHVAFFIGRHADGDHGALDQIRLGVDLLLRAEQRWPALRAAILSGTP